MQKANSVSPLALSPSTCLVGMDSTFGAGTILTRSSCPGCVYSSRALRFPQEAEAALLLGSPDRKRLT